MNIRFYSFLVVFRTLYNFQIQYRLTDFTFKILNTLLHPIHRLSTRRFAINLDVFLNKFLSAASAFIILYQIIQKKSSAFSVLDPQEVPQYYVLLNGGNQSSKTFRNIFKWTDDLNGLTIFST
jgi:hypothetical protein